MNPPRSLPEPGTCPTWPVAASGKVMKSMAMSEIGDTGPPPSLLAVIVGHFLIGLLVVAVTKAIFRQKPAVAILAGLIALAAHHNFDAPLARRLSDLGI
jgi:hypothetical protein